MKIINFLSMDPSFRNTAIVKGQIVDGIVTLTGYELTITSKTKNKKIRASSDAVDRCRILMDSISDQLDKFKPNVTFSETPSGSQSAASMKGYGISCALIALLRPPAIQVSPMEVKVASVGSKTASKEEMIAWAVENHPELDWPRKPNGDVVKAKGEHIADAIAVVYAGMKTDQYKQIESFL